ncbi:plasmid replication DNA-binding protein KfrA [Methylobacter tundripaludum]|uniref:Plasmid replication DNA-binding protein KfrA n=1 Tax=Methylobacter tundripaludum TaxID=173365 RepID=A0A2S6GE29_9GAMM|nr:DNA-binding protein [Methylobacter tundripaludum]PPK63473.1 plasmid replication DNA-binding protein KfrA [Methylobacter tundripaludum]
MNNISQISKAKRLTEEEVHTAAEELKENGVKVSSIEVYKFLGRGSLTTITNFLKTWNQEETTNTLPALISLPESLGKAAEQLIIKLWAESQILAEKEISSQREALRQAEVLAAEKIAEAEAFSEEQASQIEALETKIERLYTENNELKKAIDIEQDERHKAVCEKAVCEQKLNEAEKRFDYVNAALIEQQKANQKLTTENITLKEKLEADIKKLEKSEDNLKKAKERAISQEAENKKAEIKTEVQRNQIDQLVIELKDQKELTAKEASDNKALREKAAKLEGELMAWKEIKPGAKKTTLAKSENKPVTKNQKATEFKQTEWPE